MRVGDPLTTAPAADVGMHQVAHDGAGPDDGDLHHEVVKLLGMDPRQRGHLRAALDLEDADGIGALEHPVDRRIVGRQPR